MNPTRIFIADDHAVIREGLPGLITAHGPEWKICGAAADAQDAVAQAIELQPDIVIMDYKMPLVNGLVTAEQIKKRLPSVEVLIFSGSIAPCSLLEIYRSNVCGYMLKTEGVEELMPALEALRRHHHFRSRKVTQLYQKITHGAGGIETLSVRETETLQMIADGKSSKEIAIRMGISIKTVETHRTHLFRKLKLHSVAELVRYALQHGVVEL